MHKKDERFAGLTVLITGAASGIGHATALLFLQAGAKVSAIDINWPDEAASALAGALLLRADVSVESDCVAAVSQAKDTYGAPNIVVNCAGVTKRATVIDTLPEEWDHILNVNLRSVYLMSRLTIPLMQANGGGAIVNVASGWGLVGGGASGGVLCV